VYDIFSVLGGSLLLVCRVYFHYVFLSSSSLCLKCHKNILKHLNILFYRPSIIIYIFVTLTCLLQISDLKSVLAAENVTVFMFCVFNLTKAT
jgi:hypothetical protein